MSTITAKPLTICGICGEAPSAPHGILGWIFDNNLISCWKCRGGRDILSEPKKQTLNLKVRNFLTKTFNIMEGYKKKLFDFHLIKSGKLFLSNIGFNKKA